MPKPQTPAETIRETIERRPALASVLAAFEPLFSARADLAASFALRVREQGIELPAQDPEKASEGIAIVMASGLAGYGPFLAEACAKLLPHMGVIAPVAQSRDQLERFFARAGEGTDRREALCEAILAGKDDAVLALAGEACIDPAVLVFVGEFALSCVLHGVTCEATPTEGKTPWDNTFWTRGNCPVCGQAPQNSWFDKPIFRAEDGPFLKDGGGRLWLHCGICGADWRFSRTTCPSCGSNDAGVMNTLREEEGERRGEQIQWCEKCKTYMTNVDLRDRETIPDMDAMGLCLMHLDMVAAERKLVPFRRFFWNS